MDHTSLDLTLLAASSPLSFPFNSGSHLPYMLPSQHPHFILGLFGNKSEDILDQLICETPVLESFDPVTSIDDMNILLAGDGTSNLNSAQLEVRLLHNKVGHIGMKRLQQLTHHEMPLDPAFSERDLNHPIVFRSAFVKTHTCTIPFCRSCALSKMTKRPTGTQHISMALLQNELSPGDCVSVDQYVVPLRERCYHTTGKERKNEQYCSSTIAVDHGTRHVTISHQTSLAGGKTLLSKRQFEHESSLYGVTIKHYHADNGIFSASSFQEDCKLKSQELTFSATNLHHQNGVAERYIQTITRLARAQMLHVALHWPKEHFFVLWPMAMDHAVWIWNNLPMSEGMSPIDKFTGQKSVWASLCYILDPKIVEGKKIPKWDPRSRQGNFMGYSKEHASNAGVILNLQIGFMSVQYHVLHGDTFMSVAGVDENQQQATLDSVDWQSIIQLQGGSEIHYDEADIDFVPDHLDDDWLTPDEIQEKQEQRRSRQRNQVHLRQGRHPDLNRKDNEDDDAIIINNDDNDDAGDDFNNNVDIGPNEGDAAIPNEEGGTDTDSPIAQRTRSRRGAPTIWPIPTIDEERK